MKRRSSLVADPDAEFSRDTLHDGRFTVFALAGFFSFLLGSRGGLVRQEGHILLFKGKMDNQENHPYADRRVGDIEGRPMVGVHIDIEKINHLAIP